MFPGEKRSGDASSPKKVIDQNFVVGKDIVEDFKAYIRDEKFEFKEEEFPAAEHEIKRFLEREIHSALWGVEMGAKAYQKTDPAVLKALEVFPEAIALVKDKTT